MTESNPASGGSNILDVGKLAEPISKLIDAVRAGTGVLYEPTRIRRHAQAEADAALVKAETDATVAFVAAGVDRRLEELAARARHRLLLQEVRRQRNIECVVAEAFDALPGSVSATPVAPDWLSQFFAEVQDISAEELQRLAGRLLSHEVARPGAVSRRTVSLLRQMSSEDLRVFSLACSAVWKIHGYFIPTFGNPLDKFGINHDVLLKLADAGLLYSSFNESVIVKAGERLVAFDDSFIAAVDSKVPAILLTKSGGELFEALKSSQNERHHEFALQLFRESGLVGAN